ncbi:hypothetical protein A9Z61_08550 [Moraxella osloensis]|nr:hypothetical protein [Moraxella osloensis]OBX55633.1 hypothetical protein A9Z61_08550 [Moraxella osloensis]
MSGFAFSHQFSKRWLATPTPVKHAIIQELDDIVTLLYPDTDLDEYEFSVPNLHDKVEELLAIERDHQEKLQAQARERELEQQRLEQERLEQQANPAQPATQLSTGSIEGANHQLDEQAQSTDTATSDVTIERHRSEMVYAIDHTETADNTDNFAEPLADDPTAALMTHETRVTDPLADIDNPSIATTPAIEQIKQDIVKQLQGYIDNYLLESMTLMNEDLNQWLKTEVEKQLAVRLSQSH